MVGVSPAEGDASAVIGKGPLRIVLGEIPENINITANFGNFHQEYGRGVDHRLVLITT